MWMGRYVAQWEVENLLDHFKVAFKLLTKEILNNNNKDQSFPCFF
jgi:hypothetical protein